MESRFLNQDMLDLFEHNLILEEKSEATVEKYMRDIRAFKKYLCNSGVSKEIVIAYKKSLIDAGYANRSINSMLASINSLFGFLGWYDCRVKAIKIQRDVFCAEEKDLSREEYIRLVKAARSHGNDRLCMIMQTICATGIRVSELNYITVETVKKGMTKVRCKGKIRTIMIVKKLQKRLLKYARDRKIKSGCIFITSSGKPINRTNIWKDMKDLCKSADVNPTKVYPHNLRHLFARIFYSIEKDIAKLADILGHSNINTTRIYIISTGEEHRRFLEKMDLIL